MTWFSFLGKSIVIYKEIDMPFALYFHLISREQNDYFRFGKQTVNDLYDQQ